MFRQETWGIMIYWDLHLTGGVGVNPGSTRLHVHGFFWVMYTGDHVIIKYQHET